MGPEGDVMEDDELDTYEDDAEDRYEPAPNAPGADHPEEFDFDDWALI